MADYSIAAVTRRAVYSGSAGTGPYAFSFACLATSDIAVYKDTTKLTETSDYTVTLSATTGTGSVTLGSAANSDNTITLVGARALARTTDFVTAGSLTASALNTDLDSLVIFSQQLSEENSRNLKAPVTEGISGTTDMTIPAKATRASKILEFDSDGNPAVSITATSLSTIAGITGNITTVAGIAANVTTVAGISANVTTVAGIASNVTSVAAKASLITSDFVADLNTLATSAIVTDLDILANADIVADLAILATSDVVADLNTLATSDIVTDINVLATSDIVSDLNTLATSDIVSDLNTLATSAIVTDLSILATSDIVTDINLLATSDIVSDLNTLATSDFVSDLNTLASSTVVANIATVATNVAGVNSFAARYRVAGSDPGSDNDAGDLFFNTGSNILKVYNGSSFDDVTGSTLAGLSDTNITSPADGSLLLYDTGTSKYIDNVISGDATLADTGVLTLAANSVDSDQYVDGSIDTIHIADGQITSAKLTGAIVTPSTLDMNGQELILDADADTSITADTDDRIDLKVGGSDRAYITANNIGGIINRMNAKPLIINGDMQVTQRATSKTGITSTGLDVQDRFSRVMGGAGTWTQTSDTDVPTGQGFTKSMKWDCTTAAGLSDAGQVFSIRYIFEAQDVQLLKYGTSSAEKLTLSFWIKSPKTGTHVLSFYQYDDARHVGKAYTISSANTWTKVVCSIPGDTTGVFDNDNGAGLGVEIGLSAGSTYTSGTLPTTWAAYSAANQWVGQVNCADNTANNVFITGVQLEIGEFDSTTIPPFQHESFGDNLARCQRYFQKFTQPPLIGSANANNSVARASIGLFPVQMRTAPTASQSGTLSWFYSNSHQPTSTALAASYTDVDGAEFDITVTGTGMTATHPCSVIQSGSGFLQFEAEI